MICGLVWLGVCFKNRPVRGPGLQWGQNRRVSWRPRAFKRRFRGFLKHALRQQIRPGKRTRRPVTEWGKTIASGASRLVRAKLPKARKERNPLAFRTRLSSVWKRPGIQISHCERFDKLHDQKGLRKKEECRMQKAEVDHGLHGFRRIKGLSHPQPSVPSASSVVTFCGMRALRAATPGGSRGPGEQLRRTHPREVRALQPFGWTPQSCWGWNGTDP